MSLATENTKGNQKGQAIEREAGRPLLNCQWNCQVRALTNVKGRRCHCRHGCRGFRVYLPRSIHAR